MTIIGSSTNDSKADENWPRPLHMTGNLSVADFKFVPSTRRQPLVRRRLIRSRWVYFPPSLRMASSSFWVLL